jgi:exosome complex component RRP4
MTEEKPTEKIEREAKKPIAESVLLKKEREFVIPGDRIVKSMDYLPGRNCFREGDSIYAKRLGIVSVNNRVISVIPLNTVYIPKFGDMVIGEVVDIQENGWIVNIDSPCNAYLPLSGVREFIDTTKTRLSSVYAVGDLIYAKISQVTDSDHVQLSMKDMMSRKFRGGRLVRINPAKVPRLIGKQGSMIKLIKDKTECRISVGQNGPVWLEGGKEDMAIKAIYLVEEESYIDGLTDKVSELLTGKPQEIKPKEEENEESRRQKTG